MSAPSPWTVRDVPDLRGKTAIVTGANSGIGFETARALTGLLLGRLRQTSRARIVTVSSSFHERGRIDFDDLQGEHAYDPKTAYYQSKLANLLFAFELQRRLEVSGSMPSR